MNVRTALIAAGLFCPATALAGDLLTQDQYVDYAAQVKCAEQLYSFSDPDRYEKELSRIEKSFGIREKDIESGRMDELAARYEADPAVYETIEVKRTGLCPQKD